MKKLAMIMVWTLLVIPPCIAQNAPSQFGGTIEYRSSSGGSTASQGIYVYKSDGSIDQIYFRSLYSVTPWAYKPPAYGIGTYSYRLLDVTHGELTSDLVYPATWILEYSSPNTATFSAHPGYGSSLFVTARTREEMVNTSVRTFIAAGKSSIAGFVISGTRSRSVLIRAVGPGLKPYGVASPLSDPTFDLYQADGLRLNTVGSWRTSDVPPTALTGIMTYLGAFPLATDSDDAVLFVSLSPGVYSVVCHSSSGTQTGEVLTEVYVMP